MSEALTVQGNTALQVGGVGFGASMFKARPMMMELVQRTSRQENVKYGEFRNISTNEHFGSKIRVVLLAVPQLQREWFEGADFSKDSKQCFSLDGVQPHPRAANPPALWCRTCPKGNVNWEKWRKTKDAKDLPPCGEYYHLLIADRATQAPSYLNVKGKSFLPFKQAMETQMSGILAKLFANVKAENKKRGYTFVPAENKFVQTSGWVQVEGTKQQAPELLPNLFDVSFDITAESKAGGPYVMRFSNFAYMKAEDRAEFGNLYLELQTQRDQKTAEYAPSEEEIAAQAVSETPAQDVQGEVLPAQESITI